MKGLHDFRNSALKQHAVCIICLTMLFPAVCYSDDEAKSKLLKSAIEKASKSEKKDDSDDQDSNKKKKNEESRKNEKRNSQSDSSPSRDHHSMDSYQQAPA